MIKHEETCDAILTKMNDMHKKAANKHTWLKRWERRIFELQKKMALEDETKVLSRFLGKYTFKESDIITIYHDYCNFWMKRFLEQDPDTKLLFKGNAEQEN